MKKNYSGSLLPLTLMVGLFGFLLILTKWPFAADQAKTENQHWASCGLVSSSANEKQRGAHVFGMIDSTDFRFLKQNNIKWITLVAWSFQENCESPDIRHHNGDSTQIRQMNANWLRRLKRVRAAGYKVFVKPHVWVSQTDGGKWRSDIFPTNDKNWESWKKGYRDFILRYATLAQQAQAEMFCIGTEFTRLSLEKPRFWKSLIKEVRTVYSGKITYAANWYKEYENIRFWKDLDYIGIQAYFPLTKTKNPNTRQIAKGWAKHLPTIEAVQKKHKRKVLFTELGYKSTADSAISPWEWIEHSDKQKEDYSGETQANCYAAFFNTVWKKDWFAGVHIWQLRSDFKKSNRKAFNLDFTPQGKPAEQVIANGFKQ